jgi:hypothetical protein
MNSGDGDYEHESERDGAGTFPAGDSPAGVRGNETGIGDRRRAERAGQEPACDDGETTEPWGVTEWGLLALKSLSVPVALLGGLILFAGLYAVLFQPFGELYGYVIMWLGAVLMLPACYFWWKWVDRVIRLFRG